MYLSALSLAAATPRPWVETLRLPWTLALQLVMIAALAMLVLAWQHWRDTEPGYPLRRWSMLLGAVVLLAAGVRFGLVVPGFVHENFHGYRYAAEVMGGWTDRRPFGYLMGKYGWGYTAFFTPLMSLLPPSPESLFRLNAALGSLVCGLAALLAGLLWRSPAAAWICGLSLAVWPGVARLSASEEYAPLVQFWALLAWLALLAWSRSGTRLWLAAGVLALTAQTQSHIIQLLAPLPAVALVLLHAPWTRLKDEWRALLAAVVSFAALNLPYYWASYRFALAEPLRGSYYAAIGELFLSPRNFLLNPGMTPAGWALLAVLGAVLALVGGLWRPLVLLGLTQGIHLPVLMSKQSCYPDILRNQGQLAPLWAVLLGAGLGLPLSSMTPRPRWVVGTIMSLLLLLSVRESTSIWTVRTNQDLEWEFLRDTLPTLDAGADLVLLLPPPRSPVLTEFPDYLLPNRRSWRIRSLDELLAKGPVPGRRTYLYRGLGFSLWDPAVLGEQPDHDKPDPWRDLPVPCCNGLTERWDRPEWASLVEAANLRPLTEREIRSHPGDYHLYPGRQITLGWYEVLPASQPQGQEP